MISVIGLNKTAIKVLALLSHARYTLDGVENIRALHDTKVEDNVVTVYVLFDQTFSGNFTKVELIDLDGDVYATQVDNIQKISTKLLLVTFKFAIVEAGI